jgi:hypothetical protein
MRISDTDRSRVVDELRRHCAAGRLTVDDYADRVAAAISAETLADLDHVLRDLPTMRIDDPVQDPPLMAPGGPPASGLWARLVALLSVLALALGVSFLIIAHWVWAILLIVGWIIGVIQGRVRIGRRPPH